MRRPGSMAVAEDEDEVRRPAEVEAEEKREENSIQKNVNVERVTVGTYVGVQKFVCYDFCCTSTDYYFR